MFHLELFIKRPNSCGHLYILMTYETVARVRNVYILKNLYQCTRLVGGLVATISGRIQKDQSKGNVYCSPGSPNLSLPRTYTPAVGSTQGQVARHVHRHRLIVFWIPHPWDSSVYHVGRSGYRATPENILLIGVTRHR